mgnify:CR=1 FL=1
MDLMIESLPRLLNATKLTIELTLLSLFFGIFVGVFFAILRTSKNKIFYYISYYYSYIFRGTPLLVQIFIIYFGLGQVEWIRESFLWIVLKEPYSCAILAFTLNTGAYSSEIFRSAFETINKGILEASKGQQQVRRGSSNSKDWIRLDFCPICKREENPVCSIHKDGKTLRCFWGGHHYPPKNLKRGQVVEQEWAFSSVVLSVPIGTFSHFVKHQPTPSQQLWRELYG